MHNKRVKICWNKGSIQHTIICIYILYGFCIQIVYIMGMMYTFCRSEMMYTKCIATKCLCAKCISCFDKLLYTFCIQNLVGIVLLILYTKCKQKLVEMRYTFCIHFVYISCIHFVQFLHTKCIHNFCVGRYLKDQKTVSFKLKCNWNPTKGTIPCSACYTQVLWK